MLIITTGSIPGAMTVGIGSPRLLREALGFRGSLRTPNPPDSGGSSLVRVGHEVFAQERHTDIMAHKLGVPMLPNGLISNRRTETVCQRPQIGCETR